MGCVKAQIRTHASFCATADQPREARVRIDGSYQDLCNVGEITLKVIPDRTTASHLLAWTAGYGSHRVVYVMIVG